jgi:serine phosphatase RsbU (regulator of sigma subunit)
MFKRVKHYFIGHRINTTDDVFEKAKINLAFNFTFFISLLAIPFIIQLYINGFWYHFAINIFEILSLAIIYFLFRSNIDIKYIGISFVAMDSVMSAGSLVFQNGHFEIQACLWSMVLITYTFFVLGKNWGVSIVIFITILYLGCIPLEKGISLLNFEIPQNQILPTASAFIIFPFLLIVHIITVFISTSITAANLMREQKQKLERQKGEILSSITYAKRIQQARLPNIESIYSSLPNSFILFKPKDIVSGDFYFFHKTDETVFIASSDCTGHGVPGAIMSMICSEKLEDAVTQNIDISKILEVLNKGVKASLRQSDNNDSTRDGMDIALCSINTVNRIVKYTGANRPLWIFRHEQRTIEEIKATKSAIGGLTLNEQTFDCHELKLQQGDTIYIFTDGYADQFGGENGKKLTTKKFKDILLSIQNKSMGDQEAYIDSFIENWKAGGEQVDDILVIGVRL